MNTTKEFIDAFVNIEFLENSDAYGYYPFNLVAEVIEGKFDFNSLSLGGDVLACYKRFKKYVDSGSSKIFMAIDFPSAEDIERDFICVFSMVNGELSVCALPYSTSTGEMFETLKKTKLLDVIKMQFLSVINS